MKFRKKPVVIEATQWFKNGDHPKDACKMVHPSPDSTTQFAPFLSEGKVVRYYRTPDLDGSRVCEQCENVMHDHGWIDTLERGHVVCPGDWIITGVKGERYPCKPDIFAATYEPVPDDAPSTPQADAEPAVWVQSNHLDEAKRNVFMARLAPRQVHPDYVPLYTHPAPNEPQAEPKREPLSDEQVLILLRSLAPDVTANLRGYTAIVRAVERHHGIGGSDAE